MRCNILIMATTIVTNKTHGYTFHWKIEHINYSRINNGERLDSPTFTADTIEGSKWSMRLYPKGKTDGSYTGFILYRDAGCSGPDRIEVGFKLTIRKKDGEIIESKSIEKQMFSKNREHGFFKFMDRKKLVCIEKDMCPSGTEKELFYISDTLKLECTIWTHLELLSVLEPKCFYARTVFKKKQEFFCWRIDKFNELKQDIHKEFRDNQSDFHLFLKEAQCFEKKLIIQINLMNEGIKYFSVTISFENPEGEKEKCEFHEYFVGDLKKGELVATLFSNMEKEKRRLIQTMDVFVFDFQYVIPIKTSFYESPNFHTNHPTLTTFVVENKKDQLVHASTLLEELKFLYDDAIFSDIELRLPSKTFKAHKSILSARSPVFRRMFGNDMKEKNTGKINITDFEENTVHRMLLYMYTDSLECLQFESASDLYRIADKYEILSLKSRCLSFLKENLSTENACDVLVLADLHNDEDLKSTVQDYILGKQKEVFCSQEWKHFMSTHLKLAADVMYKKIYEE